MQVEARPLQPRPDAVRRRASACHPPFIGPRGSRLLTPLANTSTFSGHGLPCDTAFTTTQPSPIHSPPHPDHRRRGKAWHHSAAAKHVRTRSIGLSEMRQLSAVPFPPARRSSAASSMLVTLHVIPNASNATVPDSSARSSRCAFPFCKLKPIEQQTRLAGTWNIAERRTLHTAPLHLAVEMTGPD